MLVEEYTDEPIQRLISSQGITLVCQHAVWDLVCRPCKLWQYVLADIIFCAQNDNQNCYYYFSCSKVVFWMFLLVIVVSQNIQKHQMFDISLRKAWSVLIQNSCEAYIAFIDK